MWTGKESVHHVVRLVDQLILMPQSRIYAIEQGDIEWIGWDTNTSILASLHNLVASVVAGLSSNTDVETLLVHLPGDRDKPVAEETFPTIAEFSARAFTEFMYGEG
ncbi:MAG: hypothetical protein IJO71_09155 [Microbacterium sp.]|uniref:hypothetical protein n=1 Tax=Microbacterium sp. TaxID=51671 RepID=UPI0025DA9790|nr:hypothetical protein [Microbacterium sp.]MBQ9917353.1 hypothetical protein [Microbacterium sp.]